MPIPRYSGEVATGSVAPTRRREREGLRNASPQISRSRSGKGSPFAALPMMTHGSHASRPAAASSLYRGIRAEKIAREREGACGVRLAGCRGPAARRAASLMYRMACGGARLTADVGCARRCCLEQPNRGIRVEGHVAFDMGMRAERREREDSTRDAGGGAPTARPRSCGGRDASGERCSWL